LGASVGVGTVLYRKPHIKSVQKVVPVPVPLGSVADPKPGSGARCLFDLWIRDLEWVKNQDPGWKKFESGMEKIRIRDKHPGSATLPLGTRSKKSGVIRMDAGTVWVPTSQVE
jgi:hypothetical protein